MLKYITKHRKVPESRRTVDKWALRLEICYDGQCYYAKNVINSLIKHLKVTEMLRKVAASVFVMKKYGSS